MTTEQEGVRAFVGVRVVGKPAKELVQTRKRLEGVLPKDTKWERGGYHLTLRFIGELTMAEVRKFQAGGPLTAAPPYDEFTLSIGGLGTFPADGPPKVLWAGVEGDVSALRHIQGKVDETVSGEVGPADFPFHPHITIARFPDMTEEEGARIREALVAFRKPLYGMVWTVGAIEVLCSTRMEYKSLWAGILRPKANVYGGALPK